MNCLCHGMGVEATGCGLWTGDRHMPVLAVAANIDVLGELLVAAIDAPGLADVFVFGMRADRTHAMHATMNHRLVEVGSESSNPTVVPVGAA